MKRRYFLELFGVLFLCGAALSFFLDKAYHIDDALFLASADHIQKDPLHPYAFEINWFGRPESMWAATKNPPFGSYFLAALKFVGIQSEQNQHLIFILASLFSLAFAYHISKGFCSNPFWVSLSMLGTPVFFVSATNLMPDLLLLALMLGSLYFWMRGELSNSKLYFLCSAVLASLAVWTKYFAVILFVLLPMLTWMIRRRIGKHFWVLLLPFLTLFLWNIHSYEETGCFHILGTAQYSLENAWANRIQNIGVTAAFLGGGFWFPIILLPFCLCRIRIRPCLSLMLMTIILGFTVWKAIPEEAMGQGKILLEWLFMTFSALVLLALLTGHHFHSTPRTWIQNLSQLHVREDIFLWSWFVGVMIFVCFFNWTISARVLLPGLLPLLILTTRKFERIYPSSSLFNKLRWFSPVAGLFFSMMLATVDARQAHASRAIAEEIHQKYNTSLVKIYFAGHWGLQYYMEHRGFSALDYDRLHILEKEDLILFPVISRTNIHPVPGYTKVTFKHRFINSLGYACMARMDQAGFYSSKWGILPFGLSQTPLETFVLMNVPPKNSSDQNMKNFGEEND